MTGVTAGTRLLALLGDPVHHSLSPVIQNAAFQAAAVDGVYVSLRCSADDLPVFLRALGRAGGGGNVTLPHKERAAAVVDEPTDAVRRTGACNTFWWQDGKVWGDNTDVEGLRQAIRVFRDRTSEGSRVLLLGAGGAARAALVALLDDDASEVVLLNRSIERARIVSRRIGGSRVRVAENRDEIAGEKFSLVVNATRLGLSENDPLPFDLGTLGEVGGVMDLVYSQGETPFVRHAHSLGYPAVDGREMLVRQGAASFERWWGIPAPLEVMQEALGTLESVG